MVGLICFFIFVVLVMYGQPGAKWEGAILVAVHVGSILLAKSAEASQDIFDNFFKISLRMLSIGVPKRPGADSARKSEGANLSANGAFSCESATGRIRSGEPAAARPRICRTKRDLQR
jgi:hypothetical protein